MKADSITMKFGEIVALDSVSAEFSPGSLYVLAGPNGAGKTTLLRIVAGLLRQTFGSITFDANAELGVMMQESYLYLDLSARSNLQLYAELYGVPSERAEHLKELLELDNFYDQDVATLSHGQKRRVALARALLNDPNILLLDEPFLGLDTSSVAHLQRFLADYKEKGGIALIATHELELVREYADKLMLLDGGKLKYFGAFNI